MNSTIPLPPFKVLAAALRRTTERLACELADSTDSEPTWSEIEWAVARSVAAMQGISTLLANNLVWAGPPAWLAFLAATTLIMGAAYTLWLVKRVIFGDVGNEGVAALQDINGREALILGILAIAVLLLGVWPAPLLDAMDATLTNLLGQIMQSKL